MIINNTQRRGEADKLTLGGAVGIVVVIAIGFCVIWAFNHNGEMPWTSWQRAKNGHQIGAGGGADRGSIPPEVAEHNAEVEKINRGLIAFREKDKALTAYWNNYLKDKNNLNDAGKKSRIRECIRLAEAIDPFYPDGVDPELAKAIRRVKEANVAYFEALLEDYDRVFSGWESGPYWKAIKKAEADLDEVENSLKAKTDARLQRLKAKYNMSP